jgi:hypothetical protein
MQGVSKHRGGPHKCEPSGPLGSGPTPPQPIEGRASIEPARTFPRSPGRSPAEAASTPLMGSDHRYRKGSIFAPGSADRPCAVLGPNRTGPASAYRHGYFETARALVRGGRGIPPDTAFYPGVFLFRHAVELSLKQLIADVFVVAGKTPQPRMLTREHDLAALWATLKPQLDAWLDCERYGGEPLPDSHEVDDLIADLAPVDLDGVAFRYPTTTAGGDCHPPFSSVDLGSIEHAMSRGEASLRAWTHRVEEEATYVRERIAAREGSEE